MKTLLRYHLRRAWQTIVGQPKTKCAWCEQAAGRTPQAGDSHGICPAHRAALLTEIRSLKTLAA